MDNWQCELRLAALGQLFPVYFNRACELLMDKSPEMNSPLIEVNKVYEDLKEQSLERNDKSFAIWSQYKDDLNVTKSLLNLIPKKVSHQVLVPIGPKALIPGRIVHTNEFLVNLGETWFVKRTASQTLEICDRRIKTCEEMLQKLEKEKELVINKSTLPSEQEAFGNEDRPEIIEYVTEEEDNKWREEHRKKEKEYKKKLGELRNKEKKTIETEEDLWQHLDELELQEEIEDELNRLNVDSGDEENSDSTNLDEPKLEECKSEELKPAEEFKVKRKVSFACDLEEEEPLKLVFKHSNEKPVKKDPSSTEILSPSDIYENYLKSFKTFSSVLKSDVNPNKEKELEIIKSINESDSGSENEEVKPISSGIQFNDVYERNPVNVEKEKSYGKTKVSKFKAMRMKNK